MKRFRFLLLVVLMLSITGTWNVQAQYYVVDQTNGDGINIPNVETIVPGTPYALLCSNQDGSDGQYLCNAGKSTIITDSCLFVFEVVSTNDAGEKVYVLKRNSDGKYLMNDEGVKFTTDAEEAYRFTAGKADWVAKEEIVELSFEDLWAAGFTKYVSTCPMGDDVWVFPSEDFNYDDSETYTYFAGWWGDKTPAFWSYIDTNAWKVVPVAKARAYEWLSILLSDLFPNGFIADMYVVGTNPGQCDQDAIDDCQSAYAACCDLVNNESTDDDACRAAGEALITAYDALIASVKLITPGYYYFVNWRTDGHAAAIYARNAGVYWDYTELPEAPTVETAAYVWQLIQSEEDPNIYYLKNYKTDKYIGGKDGLSQVLPQVDEPFGYNVTYNTNNDKNLAGYFNIANPKNPADFTLCTQVAGKRLVYWYATSLSSLWQVIPIDEAALEALRPEVEQSQRNSELTELVNTAQAAYKGARSYTSDATADGNFDEAGLVYDATQIASNATEPSEGSIEALLDGDFSTFYHSMWSTTPDPNDWHNMQFDLGEELSCFAMKYAKRDLADSHGAPQQVEILGCNDADMTDLTTGTWESEGLFNLTYTYTVEYASGAKENYAGITCIDLSKPYRYIRMVVKKTGKQQLTSGYPFWYLSELRLYPAQYDAVNSKLAAIPEDVISSMLAAIAKANEELAGGAATQATIDELTTAYEVWLDNYPVKDKETDGICYNLDKTTQKAVVINGGTAKYSGDIVIPETITVEDVTYTVTSVSESAFSGCSGLTSITLPKGLTSIGNNAFYGCSGLTSITLPDGLTTIGGSVFSGCSCLTSITIPEGVTSIGESAFNGCSGLTSITLPDGLTSIGDWAFSRCISMTSIALPESVTSIGAYAFSDCSGLTSITIPDRVSSIGEWAFAGCLGLTSITIPDSVATIGTYAFWGCRGLTSISIPDGITSINGHTFENTGWWNSQPDGILYLGSYLLGYKGEKPTGEIIVKNGIKTIAVNAFRECSGLTSITIPDGVTSVGAYAFYACSGLTSITIPDGVTSIGASAFVCCSGLTSITIPDGVTSIGASAFVNCSGLTSITIPEGITSIGDAAFYGCSGLTSINVPDGVTSIGDRAFYYCCGLTSITLPESITSIGDKAFYYCCGLTSITIPESVTSIGSYAFVDCSGLTSITIPESVTSIGSYPFSECSGLTSIVVEEGNGHYDSRNNCNAIIETETNTLIAGCKNTIIPNGVTSIGNSAFYGRRGLTSITIPDGVTSIGSSVFANCNALQSVKMLSSTPPSASEDIFNNCPDTLVIYVPTGAAANYDVAPWNNYQIVEESSGMEDYAIWASDMRTRPTKPITLSVQLNNVNAISDYQFDLTLPKGFSIAMDEDDLEMIYLSTERTTERKHTYSYNMLSDSLLRVICYSNSTYTFSGNEGEVLTITLDVAADVADGDYNLMIKNIEMTEPDGTAHKASDYPCKVTIVSYTPGDTNNDGNFSVTDVRGIVNMVLAAQVPDDNLAGDVNEDGVISVTDVRGVVNLVLNPVTPTKQLSSKMRSATYSANLLYIEPFCIAPGEEKEVWVMLNNPDDAFSDIQFDLYLPEGIEVVNDNEGYLIGLGSRTDLRNHNRPEAALQRDGAVRVLCYSDKAETFFGHSGDVMRLTLKASDNLPAGLYNLQLKNVELARPNMTNDRPQASTTSVSVNGNATGIGSLDAEMERGEVYDLNGRPVQQPAKGVYIINGKKVIIK